MSEILADKHEDLKWFDISQIKNILAYIMDTCISKKNYFLIELYNYFLLIPQDHWLN